MSPSGINEDRVRVIVNESIAAYEIEIGGVRHKENLAEFRGIAATLNKQDGSFTTLKIIGAILIPLSIAILTLLGYLGTHRTNNTMITHDHAVVAQSEESEMR